MILEIITIAYMVFLLFVFSSFMVKKGKNLEKDVIKLYGKIIEKTQ